MAPGASTPKGTGTVPKSKTHNNSLPREMVAPIRREMQLNQETNNLTALDWQNISASGSQVNLQNIVYPLVDYYDLDSAVTYDNNRYLSVRPQPRTHSSPHHEEDLYHNNCLTLNSSSNMSSNTAIVMPTTGGTSQTDIPSLQRSERETNQNRTAGFKMINISQVAPPDRAELKQKLHQIREYLRVTSSLISSANDGEPSNNDDQDVEELTDLVADLHDSESKLVAQLNRLEELHESDNRVFENNLKELDCEQALHELSREAASPISQHSGTSSGSLQSTNADQKTIREGVKSQFPLSEAQSSLSMSTSDFRTTSEDRNVNENTEGKLIDNSRNGIHSVEQFEANVAQLQERLGNLRQESTTYTNVGVEQMNRNLQSLHERLSHLQDLSDGRTELARVLGERDDQLSSEHCALQEKLKELHIKKQQMEKLVSDLQNLTVVQSEQRQNVNTLQDQLAHLQGMMDIVRRTETELNETSSSTPESNRTTSQSSNINWCVVNKTDINEMRGRNCNVYQSTDSGIDNREQEHFSNRKPKKKSNTMGLVERQQMLLKEELNAKKRQLEELMRKDQVQTSMINQDNYSEASLDKSDVSHYECREEQPEIQWINTPTEISGLRCDNIHPSEGWNEVTNLNQTALNLQLNNRKPRSKHENISPPAIKHTQEHHPVTLSNVVTQTANGSIGSGSQTSLPQTWRKPSQDTMSSVSGPTSAMHGAWNPSWTSPVLRHDQNSSVSVNSFIPLPSVTNRQVTQGSQEWWQKKALQLQQQLELTSNLCQSMIIEQQRVTAPPPLSMHNLYPVYPSSVSTQLMLPTVTAGESPQCTGLAAASHLHIQTMILTSLNQCCQLLWLQQRELSALRSSVALLQEHTDKQEIFPPVSSVLNSSQSHSVSQPTYNFNHSHQSKIPSTMINQQPNDNSFEINYSFPSQSVNVPVNNLTNTQPSSTLTQHYNNDINSQNYDNNLTYIQNSRNTAQNIPVSHASNTNAVQNIMFNSLPQQNNILPGTLPIQNFNNICSGINFNNQNNMVNPINNNAQTLQNEIQRPHPPQVNWTGVQALNNQVPPGNRANNYWDNFRSYSRQNLLSTSSKSNEGSSHSPSPLIDRSHNTLRSASIPGSTDTSQINSVPKLNTNPLDEKKTGKRKKSQFMQSVFNTNQQPESSNTNGLVTENETHDQNVHNPNISVPENSLSSNFTFNNTQNHNLATGFHPPSNLNLNVENSERGNERSQAILPTLSYPRVSSNKCSKSSRKTNDRNEWVDNSQNDSNEVPNIKLFDILRENVYKEVASLISANENRPHFLIQLFRDLQLISSDNLRQRTLQSIQDVVTNSLSSLSNTGQGASRQNTSDDCSHTSETENKDVENSIPKDPNEKTEKNLSEICVTDERWTELSTIQKQKLDGEIHSMLMNLHALLKSNYSNCFNDNLLIAVRSLLIQLIPTIQSFRENNQKLQEYFNIYESHLNCLLDDILKKYKNYRVQDKMERMIGELSKVLFEELYFIIHDNTDNSSQLENIYRYNTSLLQKKQQDQTISSNNENILQTFNSRSMEPPQSQNNGDLAEADQSHHTNDDEGAVGGMTTEALKGNNCVNSQDKQSERAVSAEADSEWLTFETGLDCVPSRLNNTTNEENINISSDTSQEQNQ